ncbi:MAG: hypothetical protein ABIZ71_02570 [Gemmatimonadales bacterium]
MNAQLRTELARTPRPSDAEDVQVLLTAGAWRTAWMRDGGLQREPFGPEYGSAREACRVATWVRQERGRR